MPKRRKIALAVLALIAAGGIAGWFITSPQRVDAQTIATLPEGDAARGEGVFWAGGCASCHAASGAQGEARLELGGGVQLKTEFGSFVAPNISQHPQDGIGNWPLEDFANAMLRGVSPSGEHYYPAFPYTSYARMTPGDVADLYAFMKTLPSVEGRAPGHDLSFPFTMRRGIGLWKLLYLDERPAVALDAPSDLVKRGQYLVEGPGHCGECHTPRSAFGGLENAEWLSGAVAAEGTGNVPNITTGEGGLGDWSDMDLTNFLETGFTPDFDSAGGSMASVVRNIAELSADDREAIAAYLKAVPPLSNGY
ncbi:cytochrome c [Aquamicrobium sp. LC103]|uniref:cytochrome c n=1 Tax=Aquamicrobium sp. LC103 TaxID=1120658 RepID=UPI00063EA275|nr:cytochrome c [Aquamicrobium sp. LC103]TKT81207.1 c-type cytochrome [Aquamicrobium sp. LC103]